MRKAMERTHYYSERKSWTSIALSENTDVQTFFQYRRWVDAEGEGKVTCQGQRAGAGGLCPMPLDWKTNGHDGHDGQGSDQHGIFVWVRPFTHPTLSLTFPHNAHET